MILCTRSNSTPFRNRKIYSFAVKIKKLLDQTFTSEFEKKSKFSLQNSVVKVRFDLLILKVSLIQSKNVKPSIRKSSDLLTEAMISVDVVIAYDS